MAFSNVAIAIAPGCHKPNCTKTGQIYHTVLTMKANVSLPPPELSSPSSPLSGFGNARSKGFDVVCATVGDGVVVVGFLDGEDVVGRGVVGNLEGGAVVGL